MLPWMSATTVRSKLALAAFLIWAAPVWAEYQPKRAYRVASLRAMPFPLLPQVVPGSPFSAGGGGGGGVTVTGNNAWTGTNSFIDGNFSIIGSGDPTKIAKFEVDGFTAGNTRVITFQDINTTVAGINFTNVFATPQTLNQGGLVATDNVLRYGAVFNATYPGLFYNGTWSTPDQLQILVGSVASSIAITESADAGFDFQNGPCATAACTEPALIIHGAAQNTTEWNALNHYGSHGGAVVTLTDNTATAFFHTAAISAGGLYAGTGTYAVKIVDAANEVQTAVGTFEWYGMNGNTGGVVCGIQQVGNDGVLPGLPLQATSSGTLTVALTTAATTACTFKMTADTSLTAATFTMTFQANVRTGPAEIVID